MKKILEELYIEQELSMEKTAEILGVTISTIHRRLKKYGIHSRNSGYIHIGKPSGAYGKHWKLSEQAKENHRLALLGKSKSLTHCINNGKAHKGLFAKEKNPNWQGGKCTENEIIRKSFYYKLWRNSVFKRDNYICQLCGRRSGKRNKVYLEADHIKPFALFPHLRLEISNGRTLCKECHVKTPTYGGRINSLINV